MGGDAHERAVVKAACRRRRRRLDQPGSREERGCKVLKVDFPFLQQQEIESLLGLATPSEHCAVLAVWFVSFFLWVCVGVLETGAKDQPEILMQHLEAGCFFIKHGGNSVYSSQW